MRSCKEVSRLLSESMERKLSLRDRMGLWFHLAMCRLCRGYSKDLQLLREAARQHAEDVEADKAASDAALSAEARERMKRVLENRSS
jgi:predicted AAA+ superfamily ATPase